jgi:hypothetical protein
VPALQYVHGVLRALADARSGRRLSAAADLVYAALYPTVFDARAEQAPVAAAAGRQYPPLAPLRPFTTARYRMHTRTHSPTHIHREGVTNRRV